MKHALSSLLTVVSLALAVFALWIAGESRSALADLSRELEKGEDAPEIGDWMRPLQWHASKLWFAGSNENWDLALFQLEEIDELMEEVSQHDIEEGTVNIGGLMEGIRNSQVSALQEAARDRNQREFLRQYDLLLESCNACHTSSGHSFVRIQRPLRPAFSNQDFGHAER